MDRSNSVSSDGELGRIWDDLNLNQRRFVVARQHHSSVKDAAEEVGVAPRTAYAWPDKVDRAVELVAEERMQGVLKMLEEAAEQGAARLLELVNSQDENVALNALRYAINQTQGKPTQHRDVDMDATVEGVDVQIHPNTDEPEIDDGK
ncbi:hypothetical protein GGQ10_002119 [Salinibacter ruber]|uniref:hypothetical protein n=1 Tax=Salinibacter ruber TaxID=146919 RepID=UPI0021690ABF|nr:hypothetical protein [Salinibacter ruber]MCS4087293.1 hypothetical protein [Salinibacter ruber]